MMYIASRNLAQMVVLACLLVEAPAFTSWSFAGPTSPALLRVRVAGCRRPGLRAKPVMMAPFQGGGAGGDRVESGGKDASQGKSTRTIKMGDLNGGGKLFDPHSIEDPENFNNDAEIPGGGPQVKEEKVKVFGAYLDHTVAGRDELMQVDKDKLEKELFNRYLDETGNDLKKARKLVEEHLERHLRADSLFRSGVQAMKRGSYKEAIEMFKEATITTPEGARSRNGGQYTIWLAQALDANGEKGVALRTLKAAMGHADRDVRRVAQGLEFIMLAPKLDLDERSFTWIEMEKLDQIKAGTRGALYQHMEKQPEKYSLEWYMLQKPPPTKTAGTAEITRSELKMGAYALAATLGGMGLYNFLFSN